MSRCGVKRGFFLLRDCGLEASHRCATCGRHACDEHSVAASGQRLCTDCHARELESEPDPHDAGWSSHQRDRYYREGRYAPIYIAHEHDSYYDAYDVRSFDHDLLERPEVDLDADGSFFDS